MSTSVFQPAFLRPPLAEYSETTGWLEESERSEGGYSAVLNRASTTMFRCSGTIRLPQQIGTTLYLPGDLEDFKDARSGRADTSRGGPVRSGSRR